MVYKKVDPAMVERWHTEIRRRLHQESKTNIIVDIAKREGLSHNGVYYWVKSEHYRQARRQYAAEYGQQRMNESRNRWREYARQHRQQQCEYQRDRRANPQIRTHNCAQVRLGWKVRHHIDQLLSEIIPDHYQPVTATDMTDALRCVTGGITVRPSTLEKAVKDYLAHNPNPVIKEVAPDIYARI